jgi:hypothetical protein
MARWVGIDHHYLIFRAYRGSKIYIQGMQGSFEPPPLDNEGSESRVPRDRDSLRAARSDEKPRKSHLGVISNVPWDRQLLPSNDRDTQRRMMDHREREARFNALNANQVALKPRVTPYPNSPDKVSPGTPCYRMIVNGAFRFIFVVDLKDPLKAALYPAGPVWDGIARPQQLPYWIVPHFVYRSEITVTECKKRWKTVYNAYRMHGLPPPGKFDYDSRLATVQAALVAAGIGAGGIAAATALFNGHGAGFQHDSYYAPGVDNALGAGLGAPPVKDALFTAPFNPSLNLPFVAAVVPLANYTIHPFPYNQPNREFPQQPDPPQPAMPPPAPGGGAPPVLPLPHASELEAVPPSYHGLAGVDWVDVDAQNFERSKDALKDACEQAEELDYAFALSMQGLRGASLPAVWNCIDPEYDVSDRAPVLAQFIKMYMEKFYSQINAPAGTIVEDVVEEALHLHEEFCKGWVHRHHRTLSAEVTAAADSLIGVFFDDLRGAFPAGVNLTRTHLAKYFRRKSDFSGEFANCLYHYMTSLEQMRGNRNASYRAMQNERGAYITAMKKMANLLRERFNDIRTDLQRVTPASMIFDKLFIDWHYISAQLPAHHREFDDYTQNFTLFRTRPGWRGGRFPPWQQMRT